MIANSVFDLCNHFTYVIIILLKSNPTLRNLFCVVQKCFAKKTKEKLRTQSIIYQVIKKTDMKKNYKILTSILLSTLYIINHAKATIVTIQAVGTTAATEQFIPNVANAVCGDTIRWVNVSGVHTTASTTIPAGAATWNSPTLTIIGFTYVVTLPGTYNYTCHPANGGHMHASIVVTCTSGLPTIGNVETSAIYPNPTSGRINIKTGDVTDGMINIYNVTGKSIFQSSISGSLSIIDLNLPDGVYYYELKSQFAIIRRGELIIQSRK
jgi:plastocyanin